MRHYSNHSAITNFFNQIKQKQNTMKHLFNAVTNCNRKAALPFSNRFKLNRASQFCLAILAIIFQLPSCTKQDSIQPEAERQAMSCASTNAKADLSIPS